LPGAIRARASVPSGFTPHPLRVDSRRIPCGWRFVRQRGEQNLVRGRVAFGDEPRSAPRAVKPPLPLNARDVTPEVVVAVEVAEGRARLRSWRDLAPETEVGHLAHAAVGALEHE